MSKKDLEMILEKIKKEEVVSLASEMVKIPSFTTQETECALFVAEYLRKSGFKVELQEVDPGRLQTIAWLKGKGGGRSIMFNGHLDIDPLGAGWKRDPWKLVEEDGRLIGAGIWNMKAGVASMIVAAKAMQEAGVELRGDIVIACVVGELQAGVGTTYMIKKGVKADMAVITEPFGVDNITTVHAGVINLVIYTYGIQRHISEMEKGVNAIEKMTKVIDALKKIKFSYKPFPELPGLPRLLIGSIVGGRSAGEEIELRAPNNVPEICKIYVDVRFVPGQTPESVIKDIDNAIRPLAEEDPSLKYKIEYPAHPRHKIARVAMMPLNVPKDEYIVRALAKNYRLIKGRTIPNIGATLPLSYGGTDATHLAQAGIPAVNYGPQGEFVPEQSVPVDEIMTCTKVLALTAHDVCE